MHYPGEGGEIDDRCAVGELADQTQRQMLQPDQIDLEDQVRRRRRREAGAVHEAFCAATNNVRQRIDTRLSLDRAELG